MKQTQTKKVLQYLRSSPNMTANRINIGTDLFIVDVPKVISLLRRKGHTIRRKLEKNGTATYTLQEKPYQAPMWAWGADGVARQIK